MANTFGGQWFDMQWRPQLRSAAWREALSLYVDLLRQYGPADAVERGYNGNLELFNAGRCAIWVDASVAAGFVTNRKLNSHAAEVGFAPAPTAVTPKGARWLWAWALAIPKGIGDTHASAAQAFVGWATSREYVRRVAALQGWGLVPAGNRRSTYAEPGFQRAAPWAAEELAAIRMANPHDATLSPSPYTGVQFAAIPEFASIGDAFGQAVADAVSGLINVDTALARGQSVAEHFLSLRGTPSPGTRPLAKP
jgi:sorbitol/mannitol transport system substrate-binding protein